MTYNEILARLQRYAPVIEFDGEQPPDSRGEDGNYCLTTSLKVFYKKQGAWCRGVGTFFLENINASSAYRDWLTNGNIGTIGDFLTWLKEGGSGTPTVLYAPIIEEGQFKGILPQKNNRLKRIFEYDTQGNPSQKPVLNVDILKINNCTWDPNMSAILNSWCYSNNNHLIKMICIKAGITSDIEPIWGNIGTTINDGTVQWLIVDIYNNNAVKGDGTVGLTNLITNGDFSKWSNATTPTGWTGTCRKGVIHSGCQTATLDIGQNLIYDLTTNSALSNWTNRTFTISCWMNTSLLEASSGIRLNNGTSVENFIHPSSSATWQLISHTFVAGNCTKMQVEINSNINSVNVYGLMVVEGSSAFAFSPNVMDYPLVKGDGTVGLQNLIMNGDFNNWTNGDQPPDNWTGLPQYVRKSGTGIVNANACNVHGNVKDAYTEQQITSRPLAYWQGKTVTVGCWMVSIDVISSAIVVWANGGSFYRAVGNTKANTWEWVTLTMTVDVALTQPLTVRVQNGNATNQVYYSGVCLYEGASAFAWTPSLPVSSSYGFPNATIYSDTDCHQATSDCIIIARSNPPSSGGVGLMQIMAGITIDKVNTTMSYQDYWDGQLPCIHAHIPKGYWYKVIQSGKAQYGMSWYVQPII